MALNSKSTFAKMSTLIMLLWGSTVFAADSTQGAFSGSVTPTTSANQPFLLDTGNADVISAYPYQAAPGNFPPGTPVPAGAVWNSGYIQPAGAGVPPSMRMTVVTNPRVCPNDFKPVVTVTPYKSLAQGNESMKACADSITYYYSPTQYWFGVWVNTVSDVSGSNYVPATSFFWSVYCYPTSTYATTVTPNFTGSATGGQPCGPSSTIYAKQILDWDKGFVVWAPGTGNIVKQTTTNRLCPVNYTPYATIRSGTNYASANTWEWYRGGGICVNAVTPSGNRYIITYLTQNKYSSQSESAFMSTSDGSNWFSLRQYGNVNNSLCPFGICGPVRYLSDVNQTNVESNDYAGNIVWEVYCYPPGLTPPAYYCSSVNPFD